MKTISISCNIERILYIGDMTIPSTLFPGFDTFECTFDFKEYFTVIEDRGSKYTVSGGRITKREDIKPRLRDHLSDKYYKKATHNTYAFRIQEESGAVIEGKNDDGETGAGQCILRELQRVNAINCIVIVTRYFGGVKLMGDRFRHVVDATKIFLERVRKK